MVVAEAAVADRRVGKPSIAARLENAQAREAAHQPIRRAGVRAGLRRVLQMSGGVSSRIFRMLNDLAIEAIEKGEERITDNAVETYKPVSENEVAFQ